MSYIKNVQMQIKQIIKKWYDTVFLRVLSSWLPASQPAWCTATSQNYYKLCLFGLESFPFKLPPENCARWGIGSRDRPRSPLTLTCEVWPWPSSQASYGHDPYTCKRSRSKVTQFKS